MANPLPISDPIAREFVDSVLADWNGDLGFAPGILEELGASEFDLLDLLLVITTGATTSLEKETAHETVFDRFAIVEGAPLCVTLTFDPHFPGLTIAGFSKL